MFTSLLETANGRCFATVLALRFRGPCMCVVINANAVGGSEEANARFEEQGECDAVSRKEAAKDGGPRATRGTVVYETASRPTGERTSSSYIAD